MSRWVPVGGCGAAGTHSRLGSTRRRSCPGERVCFCRVFSLSVSLLFLFPLFAVLLNCPYPNPPVSASFFSFSSARRQGEGRPRGAFVASGSRNQNSELQYYTLTLNMYHRRAWLLALFHYQSFTFSLAKWIRTVGHSEISSTVPLLLSKTWIMRFWVVLACLKTVNSSKDMAADKKKWMNSDLWNYCCVCKLILYRRKK